ncbi:MAG: hypothetical protein CL484_12975 [Acidobacteria bacterium]|nr:hypothetical protein [Acidobacteriota bacterium]
MRCQKFLGTAVLLLIGVGGAGGQTPDVVEPAHQRLEAGTRTDDLGITIGIPVEHPGRRYPASNQFPTGPAVGVRLPEFSLPNQQGEVVDFHADRGRSKSIVVFYRSAVW